MSRRLFRSARWPRIAEYSGRGSLASWTQVLAMRVALDLRPARAQQGLGALHDLAGEQDPELRSQLHVSVARLLKRE